VKEAMLKVRLRFLALREQQRLATEVGDTRKRRELEERDKRLRVWNALTEARKLAGSTKTLYSGVRVRVKLAISARFLPASLHSDAAVGIARRSFVFSALRTQISLFNLHARFLPASLHSDAAVGGASALVTFVCVLFCVDP
jgi:hypothetical protein